MKIQIAPSDTGGSRQYGRWRRSDPCSWRYWSRPSIMSVAGRPGKIRHRFSKRVLIWRRCESPLWPHPRPVLRESPTAQLNPSRSSGTSHATARYTSPCAECSGARGTLGWRVCPGGFADHDTFGRLREMLVTFL